MPTPTAWTARLQWFTAAASLITTVGTAIVLGYVSPDMLHARFPDLTDDWIGGFLPVFQAVGFVFLAANAIGLLAPLGRPWVFYVVLVLDLVQGIGFVGFDRQDAGLRGLGLVGSIATDGGGGLVGLVLLASLLRYRTAWARRRTPAPATA